MAIITISRGTMSGGEALAGALSNKLGWPAVTREVVTEAAERHGVSEKIVSEQLTKGPGWFKRYTAERRLYLTAVESALLERALKGSYIYHGYAGHLLLKGIPGVLKVRLIAPMEYRVRNIMARKGFGREEGLRYIQQVDKERAQWTQFLYNVDWSDPSNYDVVFNLLSLSVETIADMICKAVASPEFEDTPESRAAFEQGILACRVKDALVRHESTRGMDLSVAATGRAIKVTGSVVTSPTLRSGFDSIQRDIAQVVRSVPEVESVDIEVRVTTVPVE